MTSDEVLLAVEDLTIRRGGIRLVSGLNFTVRRGQALWVRGRNGAGKTSLLRTVCGLLAPDRGRVVWTDAVPGEGATKRHGFYLGHLLGLNGDLNALECLQFLDTIHGGGHAEADCLSALEILGLHPHRFLPVRLLSEGQRKRVALARLVLNVGQGLWVLDEPMDTLDSDILKVVHSLLDHHLHAGGGILLTSHIPVLLEHGLMAELDLDSEVIS